MPHLLSRAYLPPRSPVPRRSTQLRPHRAPRPRRARVFVSKNYNNLFDNLGKVSHNLTEESNNYKNIHNKNNKVRQTPPPLTPPLGK